MTKQMCFDFLKDVPSRAIGGLTPAEYFDQLRASIRKENVDRNQLIETILDEARHNFDPTKEQKAKWHSLIAFSEAVGKIDLYNDPKLGTIGLLTGVYRNVKFSGHSIDNEAMSWYHAAMIQFTKVLKENKCLEYWQGSPAKGSEYEIARALFNIDDAPNEKAKVIAQAIKKETERYFLLQNRYGADNKLLPDFIATTTHNIEKLLQPADTFGASAKLVLSGKSRDTRYFMARERWKKYIKPKLNIAKTFNTFMKSDLIEPSDVDINEMLNKAYETLTKPSQTSYSKYMDLHRIFHWADADSWVDYNRQYGSGTLIEATLKTLRNTTRRYTILKTMGKDPNGFVEKIKKHYVKDNPNTPSLAHKLKAVDKYKDSLLGLDNIPHSYMGAQISKNLRILQNLTKLSAIVAISLSDHAQAISALRANGISAPEAYGEFIKNYFSSVARNQRREVGDLTGITAEHTLGGHLSRYATADTSSGLLARAQNTLFKLNGQLGFDVALRGSFATTLARYMARNVDKSFKNLNKNMQNTLTRYGIDEEFMSVVRQNKKAMAVVSGEHFLTPDIVHEFSDESLNNYISTPDLRPEDVTEMERENAREEMQNKLATYFADQTNTAQMQLGASERAIMYRGSNPGTVLGEVARFFWQFKFYGLAISRRTLGRMYHMSSGKLDSTYAGLNFAASAYAFGMISLASQSLIKNGTVPDPRDWHNHFEAAIEGGVFGMMGSLLYSHQHIQQNSLVGDYAGPVAGEFNDIRKLMYALFDFRGGKRTTYLQGLAKQANNFFSNHMTPGFIGTNNVFSHMLNEHIMNSLDPSYGERQRQNNDGSQIQIIPANS